MDCVGVHLLDERVVRIVTDLDVFVLATLAQGRLGHVVGEAGEVDVDVAFTCRGRR